MNALEHARLMLTAVQEGMSAWATQTFTRAGVTGYQVLDDFPDDLPSPWLVVRAWQVVPWPKMVETTNPIPLVGPSGSTDEGSQNIPDLWRQYGRAFSQAVDRLFPRPEGGNRSRVIATTALADLPAPVRSWYQAQSDTGEGLWLVGGQACRMPTLMWRPPLTVRVTCLLMAGGRAVPDTPYIPGIAALGVLSLAINQDRTMRLRVAPIPAVPELWTLTRAMADGIGGELGAELSRLLDLLTVPADYPVTMTPTAGPNGDDAFDLMRALGRPLLPALHVALHLPLGAGPELGPGTAPTYSTRGKDPNAGAR